MGKKKVARSFVIHTVHEQWSARRHGCVISDIKFIMKTFSTGTWTSRTCLLLYINLLVNAICIKPFSNICDVDNCCVLKSRTGYFLLTHPVLKVLSLFNIMHKWADINERECSLIKSNWHILFTDASSRVDSLLHYLIWFDLFIYLMYIPMRKSIIWVSFITSYNTPTID